MFIYYTLFSNNVKKIYKYEKLFISSNHFIKKYSLIHLLTKIDSIFNLLYIHLQKVIFMLIFTALLLEKKENEFINN